MDEKTEIYHAPHPNDEIIRKAWERTPEVKFNLPGRISKLSDFDKRDDDARS